MFLSLAQGERHALGLLLFWIVVLAERWLVPWHVSQRTVNVLDV